ncbi:hypothetical protein BpJC7_02640 [Weizmannia acidilactici]|uniref:Spo0E like sporulation regulatory protein n=1 Tax=Weizmannia acidilactici TaxID=2607726 RepID=A0A5J4JB30_9BACI|nr:aspartyl-phosphate phosphatase Spo0E family protein [Weizmannia acidilactici]GER65709.1 hypothetical protein BpJC4_01800 [Weizmannia acidilactici]GER68961.1 hypothetical protein BpJC7_02640 [Weizmannia acidilactici]GER72066.1 hypothetical protein BpPP18_01330 [Weizmannia acidilactici]
MPKNNRKPNQKTSNLSRNINIIRKKMMQFAVQKGFNHPETIRQSQLLDKLIYEYQLYMLQKGKDASFSD